MQNEMLSLAGVGATRNALTKGMIEDFEIPLPPLHEQKAIAHILGTLDDKIELNRRMNATLEEMAQALFKSWFVDFDPVIDNALAAGNPIPDELAPRAEVRKNALASSGEPSRTNGTTQQGSLDHPTLSDPKSLFPASFQFTEELGWIPEGWLSGQLGDIAKARGGYAFKSNCFLDTGFPVVKIKNLV
jgi:type I restriction enzyme S subunit